VLAKPPQSLLTRTWCFVLWERVGAVATEKKGEQEDIKRTSGETIECESRSSGAPSWRQSARDGSHRPQRAARPAACLCVWCLCLRQAMFGGGGGGWCMSPLSAACSRPEGPSRTGPLFAVGPIRSSSPQKPSPVRGLRGQTGACVHAPAALSACRRCMRRLPGTERSGGTGRPSPCTGGAWRTNRPFGRSAPSHPCLPPACRGLVAAVSPAVPRQGVRVRHTRPLRALLCALEAQTTQHSCAAPLTSLAEHEHRMDPAARGERYHLALPTIRASAALALGGHSAGHLPRRIGGSGWGKESACILHGHIAFPHTP